MIKNILISRGHGGTDRGAVGYIIEKDNFNDVFGGLLFGSLSAYGWGRIDVRLLDDGANARDDLNKVVEQAGAFNPEETLLIDVHGNSGGDSARGVEVWTQAGFNTGDTNKLANAVYGGFLDGMRETYPDYTARGIKEGDYMVLRETNCPAVILEGGFVSNFDDASRMSDYNALYITADRTARRILKDFGLWTPEVVEPAPPQIVEPAQPTQPTSTNISINLGQENIDKLNAGGEVVFTVKK